MSQVITTAFEAYWQTCLTNQAPVVLDEFVLADIPNLDITSPINPATGLPPADQIVYRQAVDQRGRVNNNAVAYSIVMDTSVGNFSFNAMYLINKATNLVGMIVYKGRETKTKTDTATGTTGNSLVKSMLMEYDQAAAATVTTVAAGTWQIDYSARLNGMEEQQRLAALALFGAATFFGTGFQVLNKAGTYKVQPGVGMVGGLRVQLDAEQAVTVSAKPMGVWLDVYRAGTILSAWDNHITISTSASELTNYTDANGYHHYVAKLGVVGADNAVTDKREVSNAADIWASIKQLQQADSDLSSSLTQAVQDLTLALQTHEQSRNHPEASTTACGFVRKATDAEALAGQSLVAMMSAKNVADAVKNTLKTMFAGMAFPWPTATPPDGFIALTGQAINKETDPLLYARFGATAPDMRGEVPRGWDNGRGVDAGRALLSAQLDQIQNITGLFTAVGWAGSGGNGAFAGSVGPNRGSSSGGDWGSGSWTFDASRMVRAGAETRMRNVAWNYITPRG
jgi:hypothetical protein